MKKDDGNLQEAEAPVFDPEDDAALAEAIKAVAAEVAARSAAKPLSHNQQRVLERILGSEKSQRCLRHAAQDGARHHVVTELVRLFCDAFCAAFLADETGEAVRKYVRDGGKLPAGFDLVQPGSKEESNLKDSGSTAVYLHQAKVNRESVADDGFVGADNEKFTYQRRQFKRRSGVRGGGSDWWVPYLGMVWSSKGSVLSRLVDGHASRDGSAKLFQSIVSTAESTPKGGWEQLLSIVVFATDQLQKVAGICTETSLLDITSIAESLCMVRSPVPAHTLTAVAARQGERVPCPAGSVIN